MRKKGFSVILILLTLSLIWNVIAGCGGGSLEIAPQHPSGSGVIGGRVVDESENPIGNASVSLYYGEVLRNNSSVSGVNGTLLDKVNTGADGVYSFGNLSTDYQYFLVIEAAGRSTLHISLTLTEAEQLYLQSILPLGSGTIEALVPKRLVLQTPVRNGASVTLTWNESENGNFQAYEVYRTTSNQFTPDQVVPVKNTSDKTDVTAEDTLPSPGITYFYRVFEKLEITTGVSLWVSSNVVDTWFVHGDPVWSQVGDETFTASLNSNRPIGCDIAVENGVVYLAFIKHAEVRPPSTSGVGVVYKFENGSWQQVGGFFSEDGEIGDFKMVVTNGVPYIAYKDENNRGKMKKFDGTDWVLAKDGERENFNDNRVLINLNSLTAIDGVVYVAFQDTFLTHQVRIKKYEDGQWQVVDQIETGSDFCDISLGVFNSVLHVAIVHNAYGASQTVKGVNNSNPILRSSRTPYHNYNVVYRYPSGASEKLGSLGFHNAYADRTALGFNNNTLYIAFLDEELNCRVKRYVPSSDSWVSTGDTVGSNLSSYSPLSLGANFDNICVAFLGNIEFRGESSEQVNVSQLMGSQWQSISTGDFTDSVGEFTKMVSSDGILYVVYMNAMENEEGTPTPGGAECELLVKKYAPVIE